MTGISPPPADDPPKARTIPAPRAVDAIGAALAAAYDRPTGLPPDLSEQLRALEHMS